MSDTNNKPTHFAFTVRETKSGGKFWTPIGAVFAHGKGGGFTVQLSALPLDGKIVCMLPKEKPEGKVTPGEDDIPF